MEFGQAFSIRVLDVVSGKPTQFGPSPGIKKGKQEDLVLIPGEGFFQGLKLPSFHGNDHIKCFNHLPVDTSPRTSFRTETLKKSRIKFLKIFYLDGALGCKKSSWRLFLNLIKR